MDELKFKSIYNESRNGCNARIRHPLARRFVYSDGIAELADTGCHWLLDMIGTEAIAKFPKEFDGMGFIHVIVNENKAAITLQRDEGEPPVWLKYIEYTDMPEGKWLFYLTDEGDHFFMFLPTEY